MSIISGTEARDQPKVSDRELLLAIINVLGALTRELTDGKGVYINLAQPGEPERVLFPFERRVLISDSFIGWAEEDES